MNKTKSSVFLAVAIASSLAFFPGSAEARRGGRYGTQSATLADIDFSLIENSFSSELGANSFLFESSIEDFAFNELGGEFVGNPFGSVSSVGDRIAFDTADLKTEVSGSKVLYSFLANDATEILLDSVAIATPTPAGTEIFSLEIDLGPTSFDPALVAKDLTYVIDNKVLVNSPNPDIFSPPPAPSDAILTGFFFDDSAATSTFGIGSGSDGVTGFSIAVELPDEVIDNPDPADIPEPSTVGSLLLGGVAALLSVQKKNSRKECA